MTILPKKKHQESKRNEQENESDQRSRSQRNRNREINRARIQQSLDDEQHSESSSCNPNDLFDNRDRVSPSEQLQQHGHKRNRHHRQGKRMDNRDEDNPSEDECDGYNSSDEHSHSRDIKIKEKNVDEEDTKDREEDFMRQLHEQKGYVIKQMATDGACLFRAVADQVYGDQEMHSVVRRHCMDYMLKNRDYFSPYVTEDFSGYIRRKRNEHVHGNHVEMQALSEMYNRPIEVYQYSCVPINTFHGRSYYHDDNAPIRLSYHGNVHYNSIIDPYNPTVGVGLGLAGYKPGVTNETLNKAMKESEMDQLENEMLTDKLKATDWEATDEHLTELAARESYLQWLKDSQPKSTCSGASCSTSTSGQLRKSPSQEKFWSPSRESRYSPSKETRHSPPRENHRAPPYDSRHSPKYEHRKSSQHNISKHSNKKSPSVDKKSPPSVNNFEANSSHQNSFDSASNFHWSYVLGHDLEFENDPVLAAVLAQSQQEYLDSLSKQHTEETSSSYKN